MTSKKICNKKDTTHTGRSLNIREEGYVWQLHYPILLYYTAVREKWLTLVFQLRNCNRIDARVRAVILNNPAVLVMSSKKTCNKKDTTHTGRSLSIRKEGYVWQFRCPFSFPGKRWRAWQFLWVGLLCQRFLCHKVTHACVHSHHCMHGTLSGKFLQRTTVLEWFARDISSPCNPCLTGLLPSKHFAFFTVIQKADPPFTYLRRRIVMTNVEQWGDRKETLRMRQQELPSPALPKPQVMEHTLLAFHLCDVVSLSSYSTTQIMSGYSSK